MPQYSISPRRLRHLRRKAETSAGVAGTLSSQDDGLELQWLGKDRRTRLGDVMRIEAAGEAVPVEAFHPTGRIRNVMAPAGLDVDAEPPEGAAFLNVSQFGESSSYALEEIVASEAAEPEEDHRVRASTASFVFPVFAERFTAPDLFFTAVDALYEWIVERPPFNEPGMDKAFALHGYYWRSDPVDGRFGTRDKGYDCIAARTKPAVTFYGSNPAARAALGPYMLKGKYGLVLINSGIRGGAGGLAEQGYPAWASITSCPGEKWEAVALHEIGHALSLADEYLDTNLDSQASQGEPNCAISRNAGDISWHDRLGAGARVYTIAEQDRMGRPGGLPMPGADDVGLYEGARYREDYYRPSLNCLMRYTNHPQFCPVCAGVIRKRLTGA